MNDSSTSMTTEQRETLLELVEEWQYYPEESRDYIVSRTACAMFRKLPWWAQAIFVTAAMFGSMAIGLAMSQSWVFAFVLGAIVGLLAGRLLDTLRK